MRITKIRDNPGDPRQIISAEPFFVLFWYSQNYLASEEKGNEFGLTGDYAAARHKVDVVATCYALPAPGDGERHVRLIHTSDYDIAPEQYPGAHEIEDGLHWLDFEPAPAPPPTPTPQPRPEPLPRPEPEPQPRPEPEPQPTHPPGAGPLPGPEPPPLPPHDDRPLSITFRAEPGISYPQVVWWGGYEVVWLVPPDWYVDAYRSRDLNALVRRVRDSLVAISREGGFFSRLIRGEWFR